METKYYKSFKTGKYIKRALDYYYAHGGLCKVSVRANKVSRLQTKNLLQGLTRREWQFVKTLLPVFHELGKYDNNY